MKSWLKTLLKSILVVALFVAGYITIMVFAINYLYPYPNYGVDVWEREVEARYYKIIYSEKVDSNTTVYFSRNKNGVGDTLHFGTVDSSAPFSLLDNFYCESTSSAYTTLDTLGYVTTSDSSHTNYLFGTTLNEITCTVEVCFKNDDDETLQKYEMVYDDQCYYFKGFDTKWASYKYTLTYYDEDGGIVLEFNGGPISEPVTNPAMVSSNS